MATNQVSRFKAGDWVSFESLCGPKVFTGQVVGFYGGGLMAVVDDQSGRSPRPVSVNRLRPTHPTFWFTGSAA